MQLTSPGLISKLIEALELEKARLRLIQHPVGLNWRQLHVTTGEKVRHLTDGLQQSQPSRVFEMTGREFIEISDRLHGLIDRPHEVLSCVSKIYFNDTSLHLAMMNLHPEDELDFPRLLKVVGAVTGNMPGYVLSSGRYYHFYGVCLLGEMEWRKFLASWLMPTVIVSPRYIGHCLYRDYVALRLTTSRPYKAELPSVLNTVNM